MTKRELDRIEKLYLEHSDSIDASSYGVLDLIAAVRKGIEATDRLAAIDHALRNGPAFYWPMIGYRVHNWRVPSIEEAADILIELKGGAE